MSKARRQDEILSWFTWAVGKVMEELNYVPTQYEKFGMQKYLRMVMRWQSEVELNTWTKGTVSRIVGDLTKANIAKHKQAREQQEHIKAMREIELATASTGLAGGLARK